MIRCIEHTVLNTKPFDIEETGHIFRLLLLLSLIQGNAIISSSKDVKKEHVLSSVTLLPGREWTEKSYLSL